MAEIVNLRRARKQKARDAAAERAAANRIKFGVTKQARVERQAETAREDRAHDGRKLERE